MSYNKILRREKIKKRIRGRVFGTESRPRMSVFRSNKSISVQVINDDSGKTLLSLTSLSKDISSKKVTKVEIANIVGKEIAVKCLEKGISMCTFDRNGYLYHGRVKSLVEGAREAGLQI